MDVLKKDIIAFVLDDEDPKYNETMLVDWSYSVAEPMVCLLHMWSGEDRQGPKTNVWTVGRELLAECLIDGKPHVGEGDILVLYNGPHYVKLSISNEDMECFEIAFKAADILRFLDLTYLKVSRQEETEKTMNIVLGQFDAMLGKHNAI